MGLTEKGLTEKVEFVGRVDASAMPELCRCAVVAINPSRVDNVSNAALEALAADAPAVSTRVGGVPFVVEHERTARLGNGSPRGVLFFARVAAVASQKRSMPSDQGT